MMAQYPCRSLFRLAVQGLLFIYVLLGTNAETSCKQGCPESDNGYLKFAPGNVYEYNIESVMTVGTNSKHGHLADTSLRVGGNVKIYAEGNCGYTLQLSSFKVTATKENVDKKTMQSIQKPVYFTMYSGKVEPELCAEQGDSIFALNIKRAVISLLQSTPDTVQEVDVFGQCPTHTSVTRLGDIDIVSKVRNLNKCNFRTIINSGFLTNALQVNPKIENTSLLKADYNKESKIEQGIISSVQVVEEYKYIELSKSEIGMHAKVVTNLKLRHVASATAPTHSTGVRSVSIIFQQPGIYTSKNIGALKSALTELVQQLDGYVKNRSAKGFIELIRLMRNSDTETLLELSGVPLPNKVLARKVYFDALFRTATSDSARAILKQLNKLSEKEKIIAMLSLNLIRTVDRDTLNQAANLLNQNAIKEVYLAIGSLVSKYCKDNSCKNGEIYAISKRFAESLRHCKANTKKDEERILYVLKGIGNTHYITNDIANSLLDCVTQGRSSRIRVAALQAISSADCDANLQNKAMELLANRNEDSELRIEAFLAVIKCPSGEVANKISEIVNSEQVNQVGGFITSTLRVIRDSTDEEKEAQRYHLGNIHITKAFPYDFRRYSYNHEISYKMEDIGLSASADYKLIYSQNGFLPRSAKLNVKAEDFGINVNILDASIRQENLEKVLEYFFGPKGLVNKDLSEILSEDDNAEAQRSRRSVADDSLKVAKKYKSYGSKNINDLNFDLSLKFFGSDILFLSLNDYIPSTFDEIVKEFTAAFEKVKKDLTNYNKEFTSHNFFMDTEVIYPTGVGVPLEVVSEGFMANKLDFGISFDVDNLLHSNWYDSKYKLKLIPSVDIHINLRFGFNAFVLSSGFRKVFTAHTATGTSVEMTFINEGNGFDMSVEIPREKIDLINVKLLNDFYVAEQNKEIKSIFLKSKKDESSVPAIDNCYSQFESLGFTTCFISRTLDTNIEGILMQPFDFSLYVMTERHINLKGVYNNIKENFLQWKLYYSTPGAKDLRESSLTVELGLSDRYYGRASLDNARYHLGIEAGMSNNDKELVWYAQYERDKDIKTSKVGFAKNGNEYRPIIHIQDANGVVSNEINGYRVDGRLLVEKFDNHSKLSFEKFQISNKDNYHIILNGWGVLEPSSIFTELQLTANKNTLLIKSKLKVAANKYIVALFVNDANKLEDVYGGSVQIEFYGQTVSVDIQSKFREWEASSSNEVQYVSSEGSNKISASKFTAETNVKHKQKNIGSLKVHGLTAGKNKFEIYVNFSAGKETASFVGKYAANQNAQNDYQLSANVKVNQHFVDIVSKCDVVANHYVLDNVLTTSWESALTLSGKLGQSFSPQDIYIDLLGSVQVSAKNKPTHLIFQITSITGKTNTEFMITRNNAEIIKVVTETHHLQDNIIAGKVNAIIKNVITAKGDFRVDKNGKGDLTAVMEIFTDLQHKVDLSFKFHIQKPKYDAEVNMLLDSQQNIYIKTENTVENFKFNTKNEVEWKEKKVAFDANGIVKGEGNLNSEILGSFTCTCPEGRVLSGSFKRKINTNTKTGIGQGHMNAQLIDQIFYDGHKQILSLSSKIEKFNMNMKDFALTSHLTYTNYENQTLDADWHIQKLPNGQNKMINFGINIKGPLAKNPIEISFVADEYSPRHAIFNFSGKYGDVINGKINANYDLGLYGRAFKYEAYSNIELPNTSLKRLELLTKGQFSKPQTEGENYIFKLNAEEKSGREQYTKLYVDVKASEKDGALNINLHTHKMKMPLEIDSSYLRAYQGSLKEGNAKGFINHEFQVKYGDKFLKSSNALSFNSRESIVNRLTVTSTFEDCKTLELEVNHKLIDIDSYKLNVVAYHNENSYKMETAIYHGMYKKGVEALLVLPNRQPVIAITIIEVNERHEVQLRTELANIFNLDFKLTGQASFHAINDFNLVALWNSAKLDLNNYELEVHTEGTSLSLLLKNNQGEIFSGTTACVLKKENNKSVVEGQGTMKYKGNAQNVNFRLSRQMYEMATDKEVGFSYNFNGNFGTKNAVSTFKATTKDFNIQISICEEKKQCANFQVFASNDLANDEMSVHSLLVILDLRETGFPYEFQFQSKNVREGFKLQYVLDSSLNSNNNLKYNLLANLQPTNAIVQLKLPSREILLESHQKYPAVGLILGHYEYSFDFFIDKKNKPQDVTRFLAQMDLTGKEDFAVNTKGLLKLEHPTIRSLTISGKLDASREQNVLNAEVIFDIFKQPEQQIIAACNIKNVRSGNSFNITSLQVVHSPGLNMEYILNSHISLNTEQYEFSSAADLSMDKSDLRFSSFVYCSKERAELSIYNLKEEVVKLVVAYSSEKKVGKFNGQLKSFGKKSVEIKSDLQATMAKINLVWEGLLNAEGEVKLGKELKFQIGSTGKELMKGYVGLNTANLSHTTYTANEENFLEFMEKFKNELKQEMEVTTHFKQGFEKLKEILKHKLQVAKQNTPDFSELKNSYQIKLNEIAQELNADPAMKELLQTLFTIYTKFTKFIGELTKLLNELYEKLFSSYMALCEKYQIIVTDSLLPAWQEFSSSTCKILSAFHLEIIKLFSRIFKSILEAFHQYDPALKNYGKAVIEALKPFQDAFDELYKSLSTAAENLINECIEYWSSLPSFEAIQVEIEDKVGKMQLGRKLLELINNVFDQLIILPLTAETTDFLQKLHHYVVAKMRHEEVDDENLVEELVRLCIKAARSIWSGLDLTALTSVGLTKQSLSELISNAQVASGLSEQLFSLLTFRSSVINFLINEDWENWFTNYIFNSWTYFNDFNLKGHIADGRHFFSFDSRYIYFNGNCKYILAQDLVDNNFTIIAQINNGKLKSIFITDREGQFMEVNDAGVLKLNGNVVEYPQHVNGLHSWRLYYTVYMFSEYGVQVACTTDLKVCHLDVNGFYTTKVRGLLGNGNAEPYDDFTQIDGSIAKNTSTFINGYGLGKCIQASEGAQPDDANIQRTDICNEIFGYYSTLAIGYLLINSNPYRSACDQNVLNADENNKLQAACNIATAYASALKLEGILVFLPKVCLQCSGQGIQRELGQEFTVKLPTNKADLVFVVDVDVSTIVMGSLVAPIVTEVREKLKTREFTDIQIGVIAYSANQRYPTILTSDNGKLNYRGNLAEVKLTGPKPIFETSISQMITEKKLLDIFDLLESLVKSFVIQPDELAFRTALNYPFRPGATKSIIAVRSNNLKYNNVLKFVREHFVGNFTELHAALLHVIAPVVDLSLEGVPSEKLIGFNSRLVATLDGKDAKKRAKLQYKNDIGIDFVLNNGGWVFTTQKFDQLKPEDQRKAVNLISTSLADTLFKTETVANCRCSSVHGIYSQHKCVVKSSSFVPNKRIKA